jgi:short-subunit dehydrogenase
VALAEWLSITYGPAIKVSCLCPQGVTTNMILREDVDPSVEFLRAEAITAEVVAEAVIEGLAVEKFLILPHPEVASYFMRKASDYDRWIRGMRRLHAKIQSAGTKDKT